MRMFKKEYYCLVAGLPDIVADDVKIQTSVKEFQEELKENLQPADYKEVQLVFLAVDNRNFFNIILGQKAAFLSGGNYTKEDIEEKLKNSEGIEEYLQNFISAYRAEIPIFEKRSWENQLAELYNDFALNKTKNKFLAEWFQFDIDLKNILTALNCRKHDLEIAPQLIGKNEITDALKKSTAKDFGLSFDNPHVTKIVQEWENNDITARERFIDEIRWDYLDEKVFFHYFTIERVMSFVLKLQIVERWATLDRETGRNLFQRLLDELGNSYTFPEEFTV